MASVDSTITIELNEDDRKLLRRIIELLERIDEKGLPLPPPYHDGNISGRYD